MTTELAEGDAIAGHVRRTIRELAQLDGMSMTLGGLVSPSGDRLVLSELHKLRTQLFRGAVIRPGIGLGGVALRLRRPAAVQDYVGSTDITHHFDQAAMADQIRSAVALPVLVNGEPRAVIYGATRGDVTFGERTVATASVIAKRLAHDIEVEQEVRRRFRRLQATAVEQEGGLSSREVAAVNAELVAIAYEAGDEALRERLLRLSRQLRCGPLAERPRAMVRLSERESEVLVQLAAGYTNAEIAQRLGIFPTTVKTHLKSTMRKLGARNRVETVAAARHAGLLP